MPPSRRRPSPSSAQVPPVRRPRVAGLRNRPASPRDRQHEQPPAERRADEPPADPAAEPTVAARPAEPSAAEPVVTPTATDEPADRDDDQAGDRDDDLVSAAADTNAADTEVVDTEAAGAEAGAGTRPSGKRRPSGSTRPADLAEAEEQAGAARRPVRRAPAASPRQRRAAIQLSVAIVLAVVAVVLAGLAVWFRAKAEDLTSGDSNTALTDTATTSEVIGRLRTAVEDSFSYNYTDLGATEKAVDRSLTGTARCEYDKLFGQVKELAVEQKAILTTVVRDIALVRLDGDRAEALVFMDQTSTRADVGKSVAGEAPIGVLARRDGDTWKITEFNMFDQPLVNGQPVPEC